MNKVITVKEAMQEVDRTMSEWWNILSDDMLFADCSDFFKACYDVRPPTYPQTRAEALDMVRGCETFLALKQTSKEGIDWLISQGWNWATDDMI
jgi:hypothetical protein